MPGPKQPSATAPTPETVHPEILALGLSPAVAMASVYVSLAQSTAILQKNAVEQQKLGNACAEVGVFGGLLQLYGQELGKSTAGAAGGGGSQSGSSGAQTDVKSQISELVKLLNKLN